MMYEENHPQFFTATINEWHHLLRDDAVKDIIIGSLRFLVNAKRVNVYGFVIMSNHLHLIWRIKSPHLPPPAAGVLAQRHLPHCTR
jgi:putative transposase